MKKIAIEGSQNPNEQKEIIEILKSLGGRNKHRFIGDTYWAYYYINNYNTIDTTCNIDNLEGYVLLTLEQYKEKYKYMENKELQIIPPEGYEIDKENSTFEKIVFKKIEEKLTYEKIREELFKNKKSYFLWSGIPTIFNPIIGYTPPTADHAPTEHQLQRLLAINKLMNVAYYLNDGWEPGWNDNLQVKYFIHYNYKSKSIKVDNNIYINYCTVYFKSRRFAEQAIEILGEETIKLALGVL